MKFLSVFALIGVMVVARQTSWGAAYYVDDASTSGNVYATNPGNDANSGTSPSAPKRTITNLLASVSLAPGDIVYIDTGLYSDYTITITNSGVAGTNIVFQGSTNIVAGGTVISRNSPSADAIVVQPQQYIEFRNMTVRRGGRGFVAGGTAVLFMDGVFVSEMSTALSRGTWTVKRSVFMSNNRVRDVTQSAYDFEFCVFYNNGQDATTTTPSPITINNSVYVGGDLAAIMTGDYNVFWDVRLQNQSWAYLYEHSMPNSTVADPSFANANASNFYPMSVSGRFNPATGLYVTDAVHSVLIDFGNPASTAWTNESSPNGGRVNVGAHGGTAFTSRSRTNAWLSALTFNDGGAITGSTQVLVWNHGGFTNGSTVRVQCSHNNGTTWSNIVSGVPVTNRSATWNVTGIGSTVALWRVVSESNTNILSQNRQPFSIGGARVPFYLNDASTSNGFYTSAAGSDNNDGLSPASPKASLTNLFSTYMIGRHDILYIDTGVYSNYTVNVRRYGIEGQPIIYQGAPRSGATVIRRNGADSVFAFTGDHQLLRDVSLEGSTANGAINGGIVTLRDSVLRNNVVGIRNTTLYAVNSVFFSNTTVIVSTLGTLNFDRCVLWRNGQLQSTARPWTVSNSVFAGGTVNSISQFAGGDNVLFWDVTFDGFTSLHDVQDAFSYWMQSTVADPLFNDPNNLDFGTKSVSGRFDPNTQSFVTDTVHSVAIDFGSTTSTLWTNEPSPNGSRVNVGVNAGSVRASKSRTNAWLQVLSYNDGGQLTVQSDSVCWNYGNLSTGATVRIDVSFNGGASWTTLGSNVAVGAGCYFVGATNFASSRFSRWRVVLESDPAVLSSNRVDFTYRNGPYTYYVNDSSVAGDVYCTSLGSDSNLGTTPDSPKATISSVFTNYPLEAGDVVYVDTGVYLGSATINVPLLASGTNGNPVVIQGSTNALAGGSIIRGPASGLNTPGFTFAAGARDIDLRNLTIQRRSIGVSLSANTRINLSNMRIESNTADGVSATGVTGLQIRQTAIRANGNSGISISSTGDVSVVQSVIWLNNTNAIRTTGTRVSITNSILGARGTLASIYNAPTMTNIVANYNTLRVEQNASVASIAAIDKSLNNLSAWQVESGMDALSMDVDPQFVNGNEGDFHLRSQTIQGRFDLVLGWVTDTITSPLIDAGNPAYPFSNESAPNGGRVNIGMFGNTTEASRSDQVRLFAGNLNQGGYVKGNVTLRWVAGGLASNDLVAIDVSLNGGESWMTLSTGVLASAEQFVWNTTTNNPSVACLWRVRSVSNPSLVSATTNFFAIRNSPLVYFVNDASSIGDVFSTGPGSSTNWMATSNRPIDSLVRVFQTFDLEPGDRILVDRGDYPISAPVMVEARHSGAPTSGPVMIIGAIGCTNDVDPVANHYGNGTDLITGLIVTQASHIVVSNITFRQAGTALAVYRASNLHFDRLNVLNSLTNSILVNISSNVLFSQTLVSGSKALGWYGQTNIQTRLVNSIFISNRLGAIQVAGGLLGITNSVMIVNEPGISALNVFNNGVVRSDFNNYLIDSLANVSRYNGRLHKYPASWQAETTNDLRSLTHDPGFANAGSLDFHLLSTAGRFATNACAFVTDTNSSVMIDAGNPAFGVGNEPAPNGGRINIGLYGGSRVASMSPTNSRLLVLSLNSGGTVRGTNTLYWLATQGATGHLVSIDVSLDNGVTWTNVATNVNASTGSFIWDASQLLSTPVGRWRITSQSEPSVAATSQVAFTLNNGSIGYYVNDASTNGDVYATAAGVPENDGLSKETPVSSVNAIFNRYLPGPGDVIYIDTGNYDFTSTVSLDANYSGIITNPVMVRGSTNLAAGGTRFNLKQQGPLFEFNNVNAFTLRNLTLTNVRFGIVATVSSNIVMERLTIVGAPNNPDSPSPVGISVESSSDILIDRSVVSRITNTVSGSGIQITRVGAAPSGRATIRNSVLWENGVGLRIVFPTQVSISNSILHVTGSNAVALIYPDVSLIGSDYNNYRILNGARLGQLTRTISADTPTITMPFSFTSLQAWQSYTGMDSNSLTHDPGFADPGNLDFSLLSNAGRWSPSGLTTDAVNSVLIDAGNPSWSFTNELAPNGGRLNMGPDGGTDRASLTSSNRAIVMMNYNDGGIASGTNTLLRWDLRGNFTGTTFIIQLSPDLGTNWLTVATGVSALQKQYSWNTLAYTSGFNRLIRLSAQQAPFAEVQSEKPFAIRNTNFSFYVNDAFTTGDVYATAAGASVNDGLRPTSPKLSIQEILSSYLVLAGDTIYVDTGSYSNQSSIVITPRDEYPQTGVVSIVGSTNRFAGGSTLREAGFLVLSARDIELKHFNVEGRSASGVYVNNSTNVLVQWFNVAGGGHGFNTRNAVDVRFVNSTVTGSRTNGIELSVSNKRILFDQGVIWTNTGFAVNPVNSISISNSILAASGSGKFIYSGSSNESFNLNYNHYFITSGARIARLSFGLEPFPREFATLTAWRNVFPSDSGSMIGDPVLANPSARDFSPLSTGGRWSDSLGSFILDPVTSPLIDSGDPLAIATNEPAPNGERVNIGHLGGTAYAGKSPVAPDYTLVRLNDGGSVSGTNVVLSWVARGVATGHASRVEYTVDGGASWSVLQSNIAPGTSSVSWNTTNLPSTVVGLWRVSSEVQPSLTTTSALFFAIRNGPVYFYVNDGTTIGDVYCTTTGLSSAFGVSPATPVSSLNTLLDRYDIEPGDIVYMDSGSYTNHATILIDQLDAGFRLIGSTNKAVGTSMQFVGVQTGIRILQAPGTKIENLWFGSINRAILVDVSDDVELVSIQVSGATTALEASDSENLVVRNSSFRNGTTGISAFQNTTLVLRNIVLWSNSHAAVRLARSTASLENSVIGLFGGTECFGIDLDADATWSSDYNLYQRSGDAVLVRRLVDGSSFDYRWQFSAQWSRETGNDIHSLSGDPGFADSEAGDFHPRSTAGRFVPATSGYTNDNDTSVLIDAGNPQSHYSSESFPNGDRVDIGMYGNSKESSHSPTNARLTVARLGDGGRAEGSLVPLTWVASGVATGHTVRIESSVDNGSAWSLIQSNVPASAEILFWNSGTNASWQGRWRVTSEQQPSVNSSNLVPFAVRNAGLALYVNDGFTAGDVYSSTPGDSDNTGISPAAPHNSLQVMLDRFDLEPGDTIYVDTGEYLLSTPISIGRFDAWNDMYNLSPLAAGGTSLAIKGSTNDFAGGASFIRSGLGNAFELRTALGLQLSHLNIQHIPAGGGVSLDLSESPYSLIEWCRLTSGSRGILLFRSSSSRVRHVMARNNNQTGIMVRDSLNVDVRQSVLWSNVVGLAVENKGSVIARNNAIVALANNSACIQRNDGPSLEQIGLLDSNYNILWATDNAYIAQLIGNQYPARIRRFQRMANWNEFTGLDLKSMKADPLFASPGTGDFHPRSPYGRYVTGFGYVTNASEAVSPLIDTGDLASPFSRETAPNGQRIDIGLYGDSSQSSLSPSNGTLQVVTFRDGGASSGLITLRWAASGAIATQPMTLEFSNDGGATWTNIASNVVGSAESYLWDSEPYGRAAAGTWRIRSQIDPNIVAQTETFFALRQGGTIPYYVNDFNTFGDVYTTATGNDSNNGYLPSTPKATLQGLLDSIDLEPGDIVYMDTGTYSINLNTVWGELDAGTSTNPVVLRGSTNFFAGGTVMDRITGQGSALVVSRTEGVTVRDMTFVGGLYGLSMEASINVVVDGVVAKNNNLTGVRVAGSAPVLISNSLMWNNGTNGLEVGLFAVDSGSTPGHVNMLGNTVWGSRYAIRVNSGGSGEFRNNLFRVNGPESRVYSLSAGITNTPGDYNAFYRLSGALMAERESGFGGNEFITRLLDWQREQGFDRHSLSHDPLVVDPTLGDFHLISAAGRYLPSGVLTNDSPGQFSPLIDTGDPATAWTNEPSPNGGRVNIGYYGNSIQASRSSTNKWLLALTLNDGGRISGTNVIRWAAGGFATSGVVRIEYAENGVDYVYVATNLPAYQGSYTWDVSQEPITQLARWRVVSEEDPTVFSAVQSPFVIKNSALVVYVNDSSTIGDVYTTAIGNPTNSGREASQPIDDIGTALERYPFSEGDVLYIDTGSYASTNTAGLRIGLVGDTLKTGLPGEPIRIIGSTNRQYGGSIIQSGPSASHGVEVLNTEWISLEHLQFSGFSNGVYVTDSESVSLYHVDAYNNFNGFRMNNTVSSRFERCTAWNNGQFGLWVAGDRVSVTWDQGVIWSNEVAAVRHTDGILTMRNSILGAASDESLVYEFSSRGAFSEGDFNVYWPAGNNVFANDLFGDVDYKNMRSWQRARNMDTNSFIIDPLLASPGDGDFHLKSDRGRYDPDITGYVEDAVTSWAIDAGDPSADYDEEPAPNGARMNVGLYGNTSEASLSSTNAALFVVALRDGGTAANPQPLIWLSQGLSATNKVRIEYTPNDGIDWYVVATNVPALDGEYLWANGLEESTPLGRWRIILESNESVQDTTESVFKVRNGPILYYVNDEDTAGDIYCAAPGSDLNNGITVSTPVYSVSAIFERFEVEGGDVVYIDTGYYEMQTNIIIRADDSGSLSNRISVQGSANRAAGGTVLHRIVNEPWLVDGSDSNAVFELILAKYIEFSDLTLENANIGVYVNNPASVVSDLYFRNVEIRDGGYFGIRLVSSSGNTFERVLIHRMLGSGIVGGSGANTILSSVIWSNQASALRWESGVLYISNSVLHAHTSITNAALSLAGTTTISDYNNYFVEGDSSYVVLEGEPITGLPQWTQLTTQDLHSISISPAFANTVSNNFHPKSPAGRFDVALQQFVTNDTTYSWLIDTANPAFSYTNEVAPNGSRRNIGLYGDTVEASKSRSEPWLLAVTAMAGGRIGGIFPLHWFYGNLDPTNRVNLEYSVDSGTNWYVIASNVLINTDGYLWNSLSAVPFNQSPTTKWRVTLSNNTNIMDETDRIFGLNGPFKFFVNDTNLVNDVFTTAVGDDNNLGISSNLPKATLRATLDSWDIDPGDFIYVDTGNYVFNSNDLAIVRINNRGAPGNPVTILGSTNSAVLNGSALSLSANLVLLDVQAPYIEVDNIDVYRGIVETYGTNVVIRNSVVDNGNIKIVGALSYLESYVVTNGFVEVIGNNVALSYGYVINGYLKMNGTDSILEHTVVAGNVSPLVAIAGTNVYVLNNTLVAGRTAIEQKGSDSRSYVRNNIIVANGAAGTAFAIERQGGVVLSDYNLFQMRNGAWFGVAENGFWERLVYWQQKSGQDTNSLSGDPLFADEVNGDYRLRSVSGRYSGGTWVTDVVHSIAIDAGSPFDAYNNEPAPNGFRINIGAFGNTEQASKSRTTPWLYATTMNDGGVLRGTNTMRWIAGNLSPTNLVRLEYSYDNGSTWVPIATGIPALNGQYEWDTTTASNTLDALWRVVLEADPGVLDTSDNAFNIRNDVRAFYINNASTVGDIYTVAVGNPSNDGRTPATPKASLEDLLATYDTEPYDTIYVDTGVYTSSLINIYWSRGGDTNSPMIIQGSTNVAAGGTVIRRPSPFGDVLVINASHITVRNLMMENAERAIYLSTNHSTRLEQLNVRSNKIGVAIDSGTNHVIKSSVIWGNTTAGINVGNTAAVEFENLTFVNNTPYAILFNSNVANAVVQNNIYYMDVATSNQQFALSGPTGSVLSAFIDYNVYFFGPNSASNAFIFGSFKELLPWQRQRAKDFRSSVTNPLFSGYSTGNFYLQSQQGRFNPASGTFVSDTNTSWAIDKGNPNSAFDNEPAVNGGRVNIGAFGNTVYASKGRTNEIVYTRTADGFLPLTEVDNPYPLVWHVLNVPSDLTVAVQYSGDGGNEWITLESGVPIYREYIVWTNSPTYNSFDARWRIVAEPPGNTNYWDINDGQIKTFFGVHRISSITPMSNGASRIVWRGAWDEDYQIQYATNFITTNKTHVWLNLGPVTNLTIGGDIPFVDQDSTNNRFRVYRVIWFGTNGIPYD